MKTHFRWRQEGEICWIKNFLILSILIIIENTQSIKVPTQLSEDLAHSICGQYEKFAKIGKLQSPIQHRLRPSSSNRCGRHVWGNCGGGRPSSICRYEKFLTCDDVRLTQNSRIVGGEDAIPHEFPAIVRVLFPSGGFCAGTILNENFVLCARHCTKNRNPSGLVIVAGEHIISKNEGTEQKVGVSVFVNHPNFGQGIPLTNDISIIKLDRPLIFNENVSAVLLPDSDYRADGNVTAVGWGRLYQGGPISDILQKVVLPVITDEKCATLYPGQTVESQICTLYPGKDGCNGDSGGPLYKIDESTGEQTIIGITSWGVGCARPQYPGVWTEVAYFIDWIEEELDKLGGSTKPETTTEEPDGPQA